MKSGLTYGNEHEFFGHHDENNNQDDLNLRSLFYHLLTWWLSIGIYTGSYIF